MPKYDYADTARRWIVELERGSMNAGDTIEEFYRGLRDIIIELRDRLRCVTAELHDKEVAAEIARLPR